MSEGGAGPLTSCACGAVMSAGATFQFNTVWCCVPVCSDQIAQDENHLPPERTEKMSICKYVGRVLPNSKDWWGTA